MASKSILDLVLEASPNPSAIKIKNKEKTAEIIATLCRMGGEALQVVTDFDMTLTRYHVNGVKCESSYGVMDYSPLLPQDYKTRARALTAKYYPIEIDHNMTTEEKMPLMDTWYRESNENIVSTGIHKSLVKKMVSESKAFLRDNATKTMKMLHEAHVPVLVFSAGIGNIVEELLYKNDVYFSNVHVISNRMIFDEEEKLIGFEEPVIQMFRKNLAALGKTGYYTDMIGRHNAILLGDTLGDLQMSAGIPDLCALLRIGFLNTNIEERLDTFMDHFDVVLVDDQSMDFANKILSYILPQGADNQDSSSLTNSHD